MAYGQTGTGKTFTLGRLGDEDTAARGIVVHAMEDILADITPETDTLSLSYLQLYMEMIQDLLDPVNDNIAIVEDPRTRDVSLPGATVVDVRDQKSFMDLLRIGEAHRCKHEAKYRVISWSRNPHGSEGHTLEEAISINLSLSSLGKCINALAESSAHVPVRDSKLTRLHKDSFGGTARTSLVVTIGQSPRHRGETTRTIMFGQREVLIRVAKDIVID